MSQRDDPPKKGSKEDRPIFKQGRAAVTNDENTAGNARKAKSGKVAREVKAKEDAIAAQNQRLAAQHMSEKRQKRMKGDPTWPLQPGGIGKAFSPEDLGKKVEQSYDDPSSTKPTRWSTPSELVETQENPLYRHPSRQHLGQVDSYDKDEKGRKLNMYPKPKQSFSEDNPTKGGSTRRKA